MKLKQIAMALPLGLIAISTNAAAAELTITTPKISGAIKLDGRAFWGDNENAYKSGMQVRSIGIGLDGDIGKNLTYSAEFGFDAKNSKVETESAFLTYTGFENHTFSVGKVFPGFRLESAQSSKWSPFMEKSLPNQAFSPTTGIGLSTNKWGERYSFIAALTDSDSSQEKIYNDQGTEIKRSAKWLGSARLVYAPIHEDDKIFQIGGSAHYQQDGNAGIQFKADPEAKGSNNTTRLNTTNGTTRIAAKNHQTYDVEFSGQLGSWTGEVEYATTRIKRGNQTGNPNAQNLSFHGYHATVSYVLTGESRTFNKKNRTWGKVIPSANSEYGAWEIAGRYSFLNLNDKDVNGGVAHNYGVSLGCYWNENIRFLSEYLFSRQNKSGKSYNVQTAGLRAQLVF